MLATFTAAVFAGGLGGMLGLGSGCGGDSSATKVEASSKSGAAAEAAANESTAPRCDVAHGKALEREMAAMCEPGPRAVGPGVPRSAWASEPNIVPAATRIRLDAKGWTFGGHPIASAAEIGPYLEREADMSRRLNRSPPPWSLEIAADVPRAEVAKVLAALVDAGKRSGNLVLSVEAKEMPQPRDAAALAKLDAKVIAEGGAEDMSARASTLAQTITESLPPCEGLGKTFRAVATVPADKRCPLLARGIAEGMVQCNCPEEDAVLTLIYSVAVGTEVPTELASLAPVTLKPDVPPTPGATWGEIVAAMKPAELHTLWVEPSAE